MKAKTHTTFESLPDMALIQIRLLVYYGVVPYSATTIWRKCRSGEFPAPIKISSGITAWRVGEIRKYLEAIGNPSKREDLMFHLNGKAPCTKQHQPDQILE